MSAGNINRMISVALCRSGVFPIMRFQPRALCSRAQDYKYGRTDG